MTESNEIALQATSKKISYTMEVEDGVNGVLIVVDRKKYGVFCCHHLSVTDHCLLTCYSVP